MFESWEFWILYSMVGYGVAGGAYYSKISNKVFWMIIYGVGWPITLGCTVMLTLNDITKIIELFENEE